MLDPTKTENETLKSFTKLICDYFENTQVFLVDMFSEKIFDISKNVKAWAQIDCVFENCTCFLGNFLFLQQILLAIVSPPFQTNLFYLISSYHRFNSYRNLLIT